MIYELISNDCQHLTTHTHFAKCQGPKDVTLAFLARGVLRAGFGGRRLGLLPGLLADAGGVLGLSVLDPGRLLAPSRLVAGGLPGGPIVGARLFGSAVGAARTAPVRRRCSGGIPGLFGSILWLQSSGTIEEVSCGEHVPGHYGDY